MNPTQHPAALRTDPASTPALFTPDLELTADPTRYHSPGFVNLGVCIVGTEVRLVLRSILDHFIHPLEVALTPAEADALSRSLRNHAVYADSDLGRRPPP